MNIFDQQVSFRDSMRDSGSFDLVMLFRNYSLLSRNRRSRFVRYPFFFVRLLFSSSFSYENRQTIDITLVSSPLISQRNAMGSQTRARRSTRACVPRTSRSCRSTPIWRSRAPFPVFRVPFAPFVLIFLSFLFGLVTFDLSVAALVHRWRQRLIRCVV